MSIQLVLFPQEGTSNQLIGDGLTFSGVDSASNYDATTSGNMYVQIMNNAPPASPLIWYKFRNIVNATSANAAASGTNLELNSIVSSGLGTFCGVYQQLSGLTVGESYTLTVNMAPATGYIILSYYSGAAGYSNSVSAATTQTTLTWNALSINDTVFINYMNNVADDLLISDISVKTEEILSYEGQVICDLYEDEEIPLTLSVDNFKNVAEKIQSYSKDFNLPATKRNNKLFSSLFEITRTVANPYDFNPYVTTRAVLKQDGIILFDGSLRLIDIQDREGEISYNVNLYAQTIALADTLKNKTFEDINFSELEHTYNKDVIKGSWYTDGLTLTNPLPTGTHAGTEGASVTDVLKYPFVDWTGQILYANGATGNSATAGTPELTSLEQAFRPWIKIKYLIDRIFSEAGYTYSSSIFNSSFFSKLFMDFNWGGSSIPGSIDDTTFNATYKYQAGTDTPFFNTDEAFITMGLIDSTIDGGLTTSSTPPDYVDTVGDADRFKIVATTDNQLYDIDYSWMFFNDLASNNDHFILRWKHYDDSAGTTTVYNYSTVFIGYGNKETITGNLEIALDTDDKLWAEYAGTGPYAGTWAEVAKSLVGGAAGVTATATFNVSSTVVTSATINALRGEINQWDFLKGIMTMFNLVTLQDKTDPANIIIKPYKDVFITTTQGLTLEDRSIQHDWTDKIDIKDIKLTPLNDLKKNTIFKYEDDDDDYVFNLYKTSTSGHLYGSKVFRADNLTLLEGDAEIVATPFAATVSKPLWDNLSEFIIPTIFSLNDDGTTDPFDNKPRILYNTTGASPTTMSSSYFIPGQNGLSSENSFLLFTFSHLRNIPTVPDTDPYIDDFNFGECQYFQPIGQTVPQNLFNIYWLPYYNQLYNPDTKTMELKVNLQPSDIATFKFSDYVMIRNRAYRVNRIDYKPKDLSTVEFILIV